MNTLVVRPSIVGWLLWAALSLMIMVSEFIHTNYHINGSIVICALVFISSLVQLSFKQPRLIIDEEGISAVVLGKRKFLWKEIQRAELKYIHRSGDKITLVLHDKTRHSFMLFGVDVSSDEVYYEINEHLRKYGVNATEQAQTESQADKEWNDWLAANSED